MSKNTLFEIGLEELPARFIDDAEKQLVDKTKTWLKKLRISYDRITPYSTPRRLAVLIEGIAEEQTTIKEELRGPSEKIAKDEAGNWTKAAIGFTKGQGKAMEDVYTKEVKGSTYIFVEKHIEGQATIDLLPTFKEVITSLTFRENMHWAEETLKYARPIRWLVALYDEVVIPFEIAHVQTGRETFGHRFLGGKITLANPLEYESRLMDNFVVADKDVRQKMILEGIKDMEDKKDFHISVDKALLTEVRNLVEYPTVFCGTYEESFLNLPSEVLITSMQEHQRYFPVKSAVGELLPYFISVRNGNNEAIETVIKGNEKVLHARLYDGEFFYEEDRKRSIDFNLEKLERVVFQEKLGTVSEKVKRVVQISRALAEALDLDEDTIAQITRAAEISKFDLMTNMVNEFTELQGVIGEKYARHFGEDEAVAQAVREHYLPVQANGKLPESLIGSIVGIADKLDTIVGFISVGLTPTGSQDPYGLRRQAIGIFRILKEQQWSMTLESMIEISRKLYKIASKDVDADELTNDLHDFFALRVTNLLKEEQIEEDVIKAVIHSEIGAFSYTAAKAAVLSEKRNDASFKFVQEALVRVLNLSKKGKDVEINPALFETASETELFKQYEKISKAYDLANTAYEAEVAMDELSNLAEPIHAFFEHTMVMTEDEEVRRNRLALVNRIAHLIYNFADLSVVQWKQHAN